MIVVVLCTPRSGSSMVAGILHHLGVNMGTTLLEPDRWNQLGYYEDRRLLGLHRLLTFPVGDERKALLRIPIVQEKPDANHLARYARALEFRAGESECWGFKDPRTIFALSHFWGLAKDKDPDIRFVITRRETADSVSSLVSMFGLKRSVAEEIIATFEKQLEDVSNRPLVAKRAEIHYEHALANPGETVGMLAELCGMPRDSIPPAAGSVIDPSLRRHKTLPVYHQTRPSPSMPT